ncbi:DEAD-box ATP-dependent RNA helicase 37 [Raphanus sativus]|nr:DEAD-box ATP-dependent RNA helicase 37 [Raphanus sativus]
MDMPPRIVRQTLLFCATFPSDIQLTSSANYIFLAVDRVGSSTDLIVQRVEFVLDSDKRCHLVPLLVVVRTGGVVVGLEVVTLEKKGHAVEEEEVLAITMAVEEVMVLLVVYMAEKLLSAWGLSF